MRDGVPLPGVTPAEVVSQLVHREFGPLRVGRIRMVLDYHGLVGQAAGVLTEIAGRHRVTPRTVSGGVARVRAAGSRLPLGPETVRLAIGDSGSGDDHLGRVRIAVTLGLPPPVPPPAPAVDAGRSLSSSHLAAARACTRVLAAAGPLDLDTLTAAVARSHRFRDRNPVTTTDLGAALAVVGAVDLDDRWHAPPGAVAPDRYRALVVLGGGRELSRAEMISVLVGAGYSPTSAAGRMSSSHPLFQRIGPDRYRLIGSHDH